MQLQKLDCKNLILLLDMSSSSPSEEENPQDGSTSASGQVSGNEDQTISRPRRGRSKIWKHYKERKGKLKCKLCSTKFAKKTSTTNLRRHLLVAHEIKDPKPGV